MALHADGPDRLGNPLSSALVAGCVGGSLRNGKGGIRAPEDPLVAFGVLPGTLGVLLAVTVVLIRLAGVDFVTARLTGERASLVAVAGGLLIAAVGATVAVVEAAVVHRPGRPGASRSASRRPDSSWIRILRGSAAGARRAPAADTMGCEGFTPPPQQPVPLGDLSSSGVLSQRPCGLVTGSSRSHPRVGVTHIHSSPDPDYRVLLVGSRRDGLPVRTEDAIARDLRQAGLTIDLDAISDPRGVLRVLKDHRDALDDYDAVVGIAPLRADWRGATEVLTQVLELVSGRTATLLVDHQPRSAAEIGPLRPDDATGAGHRLLLPADAEPSSTGRQISATLRVLLHQLQESTAATGTVPAAAVQLRNAIGQDAIGRLERITRLARDSFGVAAAEVNLLEGEHVITVASTGAQLRSLEAAESLCTIALRNAGITVMADTWLDPEAYRRKPTQGPDAVRFYAACPIRSSTGEPIGVLCIWDFSPQDAGGFDFALLHDLALLTEGELIHA